MPFSTPPEDDGLRRLRLGMAAGFGTMTALHLLFPRPFEGMVPDELPGSGRFWNLLATAGEATSALLLARRGTARLGGWVAAGVLVSVYPANLEGVRQGGYAAAPGVLGSRAAAVARLPLQVPMIAAALRVARRAPRN